MAKYSVQTFGRMLQDRPRVDAYRESMRRTVKPGDVVLDIGCGTGYFSLLACQLGARKVYAIEPLESIELARECARLNGLDDRVEFVRDLSTRAVLEEPADVIVSDLRGISPLYAEHVLAIVDARARLLRPEGTLICQRDTLMVALMENPDAEDVASVWDSLEGVDMSPCRSAASNTVEKAHYGPNSRLSDPRAWWTLNYGKVDHPDASGRVSWRISEPMRVSGLCHWFEAEYAGGVHYSSGPAHPGSPIYGRPFFPWPRTVDLNAGDQVELHIEAKLVNQDYAWIWETVIQDSSGKPRASFSQGSMFDRPLTRQTLRRESAEYRPRLNEEGAATAEALSLMSGDSTHLCISETLAAKFPSRFRRREDALEFVRNLTFTLAE